MSQHQLRALVCCTGFVSGRTRVSLLFSCRFAGVLLSAEAARLRKLRAHQRVLDPALKLVIPPEMIRVTPSGAESWLAQQGQLYYCLMTTGAPRDNENAFWVHAPPGAQAPWWLKELSETLMTWPFCSPNGCVFNCGCVGPYRFPDPHEHVPETFVRSFRHGPRMWDAQLRHDPWAGNVKVSNRDSVGVIMDTYMVSRELDNRRWREVMSKLRFGSELPTSENGADT